MVRRNTYGYRIRGCGFNQVRLEIYRAASIPVAASISQAWNAYESHLQSKRIEQFFQLLQPEIARVKERIKLVEDHVRQSGFDIYQNYEKTL